MEINKETTLAEIQERLDSLRYLLGTGNREWLAGIDKAGNDKNMDVYAEEWLALFEAKKQMLKECPNAD